MHTGVDGSGSRCFYTWRQLCLVRTVSLLAFLSGTTFPITQIFGHLEQFTTKDLASGSLTIRLNNELTVILEASPIAKDLTNPDPSD